MDSFIEWDINKQAANVKGTEKSRFRAKIIDSLSKDKRVFEAVTVFPQLSWLDYLAMWQSGELQLKMRYPT